MMKCHKGTKYLLNVLLPSHKSSFEWSSYDSNILLNCTKEQVLGVLLFIIFRWINYFFLWLPLVPFIEQCSVHYAYLNF